MKCFNNLRSSHCNPFHSFRPQVGLRSFHRLCVSVWSILLHTFAASYTFLCYRYFLCISGEYNEIKICACDLIGFAVAIIIEIRVIMNNNVTSSYRLSSVIIRAVKTFGNFNFSRIFHFILELNCNMRTCVENTFYLLILRVLVGHRHFST